MLSDFATDYIDVLTCPDFVARPKVSGRLASYDGLLMEAVGLSLPVGTVCAIGDTPDSRVEAEVIGFRNGRTLLMNLGGPPPSSRARRCAPWVLRGVSCAARRIRALERG